MQRDSGALRTPVTPQSITQNKSLVGSRANWLERLRDWEIATLVLEAI